MKPPQPRTETETISSWGKGPTFELDPSLLPGVHVFSTYSVEQHDYLGYRVAVDVAYNDATSRFEAIEVTVTRLQDGAAVTTEALRDIPVGRLVGEGLRHALSKIRLSQDGENVLMNGAKDGDSAPGTPSRDQVDAYRVQGPTAATIRAVAQVYRVAEAIGQPPTKAVRETFEISQSTAGTWVARARSAGLLQPVDSDS